jgi:hypothetical protein
MVDNSPHSVPSGCGFRRVGEAWDDKDGLEVLFARPGRDDR